VLDYFDQIAKAYSLDFAEYTNVPEVVTMILKDKDVEGSPVEQILKKKVLKKSDLALFINLLELKAEDKQVTAELLEAQKAKYENCISSSSHSEPV
jgi:hypothetical protein